MDLSAYNMEDLLLTAIKAETESNRIYSALAEGVKNAYLKDRLRFLADEEAKHRLYIEELFATQFPGKDIVLPERTPVPLPEVEIPGESVPLSKVFTSAMEAERAASDFYESLAERYEGHPDVRNMLRYFAKMEMGHYNLLESEKVSLDTFEDVDFMWPMMHAGP